MTDNIKIAHRLHQGLVRELNEDALLVHTELPLLAVADGMGGVNHGEVAARLAIDTVSDYFAKHPHPAGHDIKPAIARCIREADETIKRHMTAHPDTIGMGTTIVVAWIGGAQVHVAWCGDSRCYRYRPGEGLRCLTHDHSYVQELVDAGTITPREAFTHPDSNLITRGLGDFDWTDPVDMVSAEIQAGDVLLVCTDGLCGYCTDEEIGAVLDRYHTDVEACSQQLLDMSLATGGHDNIAIITAAIDPDNAPATPSSTSPVHRLLGRLFHSSNK